MQKTWKTSVVCGLMVTAFVSGCATGNDDDDDSTASVTTTPTTTVPAHTGTENIIYAFTPERFTIIDPKEGKVIKEVTEGLTGVVWADPVVSSNNLKIYVNDSAGAQVLVIDVHDQKVTKRLKVGARPIHIYNPNHGTEVWTHSDTEGAFYVINQATDAVSTPVVAALKGTGHGKLLYHADLGSRSYATNTNDPAIFSLDRTAKTAGTPIEVCKTTEGTGGTHDKAYSPFSKQVYAQCTSLPQYAIVSTTTNAVEAHIDLTGRPIASPDLRYMAFIDGSKNTIKIMDTKEGNAIKATLAVTGTPQLGASANVGDKVYNFTPTLTTDEILVIDYQAGIIAKRIPIGKITPPAGATVSRQSTLGGGYFATSQDAGIAIVDTATLTLKATVPVTGLINRLVYVGSHH